MLAKTYKTDKDLIFPLYVSEKLDGVPVCISCDMTNGVSAVSRQGKRVGSIDHILAVLDGILPVGCQLIGELYIPGEDFKTISGLARRNKSCTDTAKLELHVYDYYSQFKPNLSFIDRRAELFTTITLMRDGNSPVQCIAQYAMPNKIKLESFITRFNAEHPQAEGLMLRAWNGEVSKFKAGWRSPGMLKMKTTCDIDLPVHSFEEAVSASGEPLGMVGRINVVYIKDVEEDGDNHYNVHQIIGVGPGKMTHEERKRVWENRGDYLGKYIEIRYMPDPSYNALREPRFYRFREDKDE